MDVQTNDINPGQVYIFKHNNYKIVIGSYFITGDNGECLWHITGLDGLSLGKTNISYYLNNGQLVIYSQNSLNV